MKYSGLILAGGRGLDLYPLTRRFPKALLPIGNKKLIMWPIEMLDNSNVTRIFIIINEETKKVEEQVNKIYKGKTPLSFFKTPEGIHTYQAVAYFLQNCSQPLEDNLIVCSSDIISSISLKQPLMLHAKRKADLTYVMRIPDQEKKQKKDKEAEEPELELVILSADNSVLHCDTYDPQDQQSISLSNSLLRKHVECRFEKLLDSHIYILSKKIANIIRSLKHEDLSEFKQDFLPFVVKNQNNEKLLKYTIEQNEQNQENQLVPLEIVAEVHRQQSFMKRIREIKDFEAVNMLSLNRGGKEQPVLLPTVHTEPYLKQHAFESSMISDSAELKEGVKIKRSCIGPHVKIGKNAEIVGSIIFNNVVIGDNCKIYSTVVGSRSHIDQNCTLRQCQLDCECQVQQGTNLTGEIIIKSD